MSRTDRRRADARRRAWGRGPIILRFEPLESRALLSTATATTPVAPLPDLVGSSFTVPSGLNWGSSFDLKGTVANQGNAAAAGAFFVELYASTTPTFGSGAAPTVPLPQTLTANGNPLSGGGGEADSMPVEGHGHGHHHFPHGPAAFAARGHGHRHHSV